ncbi:LCP family protein [bacterium]|nr:LCP family protein [bacterium]
MRTDTPKGPKRSQFSSSDDKYLKRAKLLKRESSTFLRTMAVITIFLIGAALSFLVLADNHEFFEKHLGKDNILTKFSVNMSKDNDTKQKADFSLPFGNKRKNILLLGVDSNGEDTNPFEGTRTDTIILMNVDPKTKSVNAISIPRDSKVYLPDDHGVQKINAAHAIGGVGMTIRTVEETLGVKIDRYVMVHDGAVREIVDAIGGIDIYVEKNMHYNDYSGKLFINLQKGKNHLNGKQVVGYLRFRHDALGDIGRTQRQQWFLRGFMEALKKPETLAKLPEILTVANKYIKTNMTFYELSQYASLVKHLDMDKVEVAMLPGAPNKKGYVSYWILDPEQTQEVVNRLIYREKINPESLTDVKASIMYSAGYEDEVQLVKEQLQTLGIEVVCVGQVNKTHTQFIAHSKNITNDYYNWLKKKTPSIIGYQFVYEPTDFYCNGTDFTIVIAGK